MLNRLFIVFFGIVISMKSKLAFSYQTNLTNHFVCMFFSNSDGKGCCFKLLCTGGVNPHDPGNKRDNKEHAMMVFFRDYLAVALNRTSVKILVLLLFLVYILVGQSPQSLGLAFFC